MTAFADRLPPTVIRDRVTRMSALDRDLCSTYYRSLIATPLEVLVEQTAEGRPGHVRGTDRRYVPVEIPGTEADIGRLVNGVGEETVDRTLGPCASNKADSDGQPLAAAVGGP